MVVCPKGPSHRKSNSIPDANNRCTIISPSSAIRTAPIPALAGTAPIPSDDIFVGDRQARSFIGTVRKIPKMETLPDHVIDELKEELFKYVGEYEAVLERVQSQARTLALVHIVPS